MNIASDKIISFSDKAEERATEQAVSDAVVSAAILALIDTTQEVNAILHALNDSMPGKNVFSPIISKLEEQGEGCLQDFYSLVTMQGGNLVSLGKAIKRKHPELLDNVTTDSWIMEKANKSLNGMTHIKEYLTLCCELLDPESEPEENICCLCGDPITEQERNNPDPVVTDPGAWCCPKCNAKYVIPARLKEYRKLNKEEQNTQNGDR